MMGRTHDVKAFSAVLLAFASLGTPAMGAVEGADVDGPSEASTVMDGGVDAGEADGVGEANGVGQADGADDETEGLSAAFALLAPTEDLVRRESGEPLAYESERAPEVEAVPVVADGVEGDVMLWTVADTVTLDSRMLRSLRGDFVARLERVAERMWNEHGMRVEVVEGYRTPQRQQALFAQGRTTEGPVVTWTQNSLHSAGAAADLYVDGSPITPEQSVLLARVAREEGLRTLHPFDSGHIQMEGVARNGAPESRLPREVPSSPAGPPQPKGVAPVAPVAAPARPARPGGLALNTDAPVAADGAGGLASTVGGGPTSSERAQASPADMVRALLASNDVPKDGAPGEAYGARAAGRSSSSADGARGGLAAKLDVEAGNHAGSGSSSRGGDGAGTGGADRGLATGQDGGLAGGRDGGLAGGRDGRSVPARATGANAMREAVGTEATVAGAGASAEIEPGLSAVQADKARAGITGTRGSAAPSRVPAMEPTTHMARFEAANGAVYRRLHMPIEGLGGPASLQLGVRGGTVDASLTLWDPLLATDLRENLHELRQALASRGIETGGMAIRVATEGVRAPSSTVEALTLAANEAGGTSAASEGRSGDSKHQSSRNGHPQFTDDHDDGPASRRRNGQPRRQAQEE